MGETTHQRELRTLLEELLKRCPRDVACSKLADCLDDDDYEKMAYCCKAWQEALEGSFDWWAHGVAHLQRGILMARDGSDRLEEALKALDEAEGFFGVCDDVCAALTLLARGRIIETRENRISKGKDKWIEVAQAYQQGLETLIRDGHPFADVARKWLLGAVDHLRQEAPPPSEEAQQTAEGERQAAAEEGAPHGAEEGASQPGAQEAEPPQGEDAQQAAAGAGQAAEEEAASHGTEEGAGQPGAQEAEPPPQPETKASGVPGGPAYPFPPAYPGKLRLMHLCAGKARAGEPVEMAAEMDQELEAITLYIGGTAFYVRATPGRQDLDSLDVFDFALPVAGDSMEPVIHNADCILVSKAKRLGGLGSELSEGDIVVARTPSGDEDEFTVKWFVPKSYRTNPRKTIKYVLLKPENETFPAIVLVETDEQKRELEDHLRSEYGDETKILVVDSRAHIEGRVSVILSPVPPGSTLG